MHAQPLSASTLPPSLANLRGSTAARSSDSFVHAEAATASSGAAFRPSDSPRMKQPASTTSDSSSIVRGPANIQTHSESNTVESRVKDVETASTAAQVVKRVAQGMRKMADVANASETEAEDKSIALEDSEKLAREDIADCVKSMSTMTSTIDIARDNMEVKCCGLRQWLHEIT